ncbi:MAG: exodeoxyribonuclease I [Rubrivivax sp.]|nr:exodeoxyribonuclease I [Rubrivivax sp.]
MPPPPPAAPLTFYWHDYETFGRVPRRDRPAQFAGLRTDAELNEVGQPLMLFCRPAPDTLPDPESVLLTGITPQQALREGVPECEFAARIESELAREGTVGVGYNSIRFDDEVTRHLFWRNLLDPYAREWANGCSRWDLLDVMRTCWALRPEGIEWPVGDDGKPSFRLERLTEANGLAHESAHDALSDVRATLALARLIRTKQRKLWDFCFKLRRKDAVWEEIGAGRPFLHLSGRYPVERGCLAVVWPLGSHPVNKNELIVWDLAADPAGIETLDAETVRRRLFTRGEDMQEGEARLPIKTIHVNKSPIVIGNVTRLGPAQKRFGIDLAASQRHAEVAARLPDLSALWAEVFKREPAAAAPDVDEDLYGGFVGNDDRRLLNRLRQLGADALARQVAEGRVAFHDARLEEVLFRYRARNFPQSLGEDELERWEAHRAARLHDGAGGGLTLAQFMERIDELAGARDGGDAAGNGPGDDDAGPEAERRQALLEALVDYAEAIAP